MSESQQPHSVTTSLQFEQTQDNIARKMTESQGQGDGEAERKRATMQPGATTRSASTMALTYQTA